MQRRAVMRIPLKGFRSAQIKFLGCVRGVLFRSKLQLVPGGYNCRMKRPDFFAQTCTLRTIHSADYPANSAIALIRTPIFELRASNRLPQIGTDKSPSRKVRRHRIRMSSMSSPLIIDSPRAHRVNGAETPLAAVDDRRPQVLFCYATEQFSPVPVALHSSSDRA